MQNYVIQLISVNVVAGTFFGPLMYVLKAYQSYVVHNAKRAFEINVSFQWKVSDRYGTFYRNNFVVYEFSDTSSPFNRTIGQYVILCVAKRPVTAPFKMSSVFF